MTTMAADTARAFPRQSAREAYRVLHGQGEAALIAQYGDHLVSDLLNKWHECRVLKIVNTPTGYTIKTYKKYAG